jgi:hypothetical protein
MLQERFMTTVLCMLTRYNAWQAACTSAAAAVLMHALIMCAAKQVILYLHGSSFLPWWKCVKFELEREEDALALQGLLAALVSFNDAYTTDTQRRHTL